MPAFTDHYGLTELLGSEGLQSGGGRFATTDRALIDRLMYAGAEGHHHSGAARPALDPASAPTLELQRGVGLLPAGTTVYYRYTIVGPAGEETAPSPEASIGTPAASPPPAAPGLDLVGGGSLRIGTYNYVLTAYTGPESRETLAGQPAYEFVPEAGQFSLRLTFPTVGEEIQGFNIYRRSPNAARFGFLTSAAKDQPTWTDTGDLTEEPRRMLPSTNSSALTNAVQVNIPDLPDGYTWRLYRTINPGDYSRSLLGSVVEHTAEGSGQVVTTYSDVGAAPLGGGPPSRSTFVGTPDKIELQDGAEVQGLLPMGFTTYPCSVSVPFSGGKAVWVCEYPAARILGARIVASAAVGADVAATLGDLALSLATGQTVGSRAEAAVDLAEGDMVTAESAAEGLVLSLYLVAHSLATTSFAVS